MPKNSNDLLGQAHSVLVGEYDARELLAYDGHTGSECLHISIGNRHQFSSAIAKTAKRYRVLVIYLPIEE